MLFYDAMDVTRARMLMLCRAALRHRYYHSITLPAAMMLLTC